MAEIVDQAWFSLKDAARRRAEDRCEAERYVGPDPEGPWTIVKRCGRRGGLQLHHIRYPRTGTTLQDVRVVCDRCHRIETVKAHRCPCCDGAVFLDDAEAISWLNLQEEMGGSQRRVIDWLKAELPVCSACRDMLDWDE